MSEQSDKHDGDRTVSPRRSSWGHVLPWAMALASPALCNGLGGPVTPVLVKEDLGLTVAALGLVLVLVGARRGVSASPRPRSR